MSELAHSTLLRVAAYAPLASVGGRVTGGAGTLVTESGRPAGAFADWHWKPGAFRATAAERAHGGAYAPREGEVVSVTWRMNDGREPRRERGGRVVMGPR